jgi:hypothetical protein
MDLKSHPIEQALSKNFNEQFLPLGALSTRRKPFKNLCDLCGLSGSKKES